MALWPPIGPHLAEIPVSDLVPAPALLTKATVPPATPRTTVAARRPRPGSLAQRPSARTTFGCNPPLRGAAGTKSPSPPPRANASCCGACLRCASQFASRIARSAISSKRFMSQKSFRAARSSFQGRNASPIPAIFASLCCHRKYLLGRRARRRCLRWPRSSTLKEENM
jgi:hypothetical protein